MADYIIKGETLTGIADAIRRKTGGTEPINPTDMPGQIDGISGGGGGSLPAGAYWRGALPKPPSTYYQKWVYFNGVLYAFSSVGANGSSRANIFKYADGAWVTVLSDVVSGVGTISSGQFVEYNGALHVFGAETKNHKIFDGRTYSDGVALPSAVATGGGALWNNKLWAHSYSDSTLYYFDEETQTWVADAVLDSSGFYDYHYPFAYNNELYLVNKAKLYKYIGNTKVEVATFANKPVNGIWLTVKGNCLYYFSTFTGNGPNTFNKFNLETLEETMLGYFGGAINGGFFDTSGQISLLSGQDNSGWALNIMHEVTE